MSCRVLTAPIDIETVFRDSHNHHKAPANDSGHLMHELLGSCVGLISGHEWKALRKTAEHTFLRPSVKLHVPLVLTHARTHMAEWMRQHETKDNSEVLLLHPVVDLKRYPFLMVAEVVYGKLSIDLRQKLLDIIPNRLEVFNHVIQGGVTRFKMSELLPLDAYRKMNTFKEDWARWNDEAHAAAVERHVLECDTTTGIHPAILNMYQSVNDGQNSRDQVLQTLDEMLFANLDVTAGALAWPFIFLASYTSVQDKVRHEINAIHPSEIKSYLLSADTYLHSVLLESARLRPVATFSIPQACPTPRLVAGYMVPAGTNFIVDTHALNIRNAVWGPDNATFRPERWIEHNKGKSKELRYSYWRYGFGPRLCMGRYLADVMIKAMIVEIVGRFDLSLDKDSEWNWDEESWIHHPAMEIQCTKRGS
jgi:cytochrome P450